jgi:hypothetical protein
MTSLGEERELYNEGEALSVQKQFCNNMGIPMFSPTDGICWACHRHIYRPYSSDGIHKTGISVRKAGSELTSGCPHCNTSFVD